MQNTSVEMESNQINKMKDILAILKKTADWAAQAAALLCEQMDAAFWKSPDKIKFCQEFSDYGGPELLVSVLKKFEEDGIFKVKGAWETAFVIYNSLCNLTEASIAVSKQLGEQGMVKLCIHNMVKYREKMSLRDIESLVRISASILCNMSTMPGNRHLFREEGVAEKMEPYLKGEPFLKTICMITLAYIIEEGEEGAMGEKESGDTVKYLVGILKDALRSPDKRFRGLCDREIALALGRLAVHDTNKCKIIEAGGLPLLCKMLKDKSSDTQEAAANTIWNLSFSDGVRQKIVDDKECIKLLGVLSQSSESNVSNAAKGALWVITKGQKTEESIEAEENQEKKAYDDRSHIMISYEWGSQPLVLKIRDSLKAAGYHVWLDVDHMHGSILQAMAEAVENSCVVLICISERYKESPNCRTEAEYAFQRRKSIIPLMMEEYYKPDGWLGMILGAKLYMDFSGKLDQEIEMAKLLKEIHTHAQAAKVTGEADTKITTAMKDQAVTRSYSQQSSPSKLLGWSNEQVRDWLKNAGLDKWRPSLQQSNGSFLFNLYKLRLEAPEFFYKSIQDDEGIKNLIDIFKFTEALESAIKN